MKAGLKLAGLWLVVLFFLTGCAKVSSEKYQNDYKNIEIKNEKEFLLYNVVREQLGIYHEDSCEWEPLYREKNTFQYVFDNDSDYVVSGNSVDNEFVLLKLSDDRKKLVKMFELNDNEKCFFPLAKNDDEWYYVMYAGNEDAKTDRRIIRFTNEYDIEEILQSDKMITSGTMVGNKLYYSAYDKKSDQYHLYWIDPERDRTEVDMKKETGERTVFQYNNEICLSDSDYIYIGKKKIPLKYINYVKEDYMIQFYANKADDMVCTIERISDGKKLGTFLYPINFQFKEHDIVVYCEGKVYHVDI